MTFVDFVSKHDQPGALVLLEGKREVPAEDQGRFAILAAYILRDTFKAIGTTDLRLVTYRIFHEDLANPRSGGTGHTMLVCEANCIPLIEQ